MLTFDRKYGFEGELSRKRCKQATPIQVRHICGSKEAVQRNLAGSFNARHTRNALQFAGAGKGLDTGLTSCR